jgi:glycosyltransferase involved in cell wall biosynthesis
MRRHLLVGPATADAPPGAAGAAARNKLIAMAGAIRAAGGTPLIVTTEPSPRAVAHRAGVGFVAVPTRGRRALRRLSGGVALAAFGLRRIHADDRVILYNAFPEYLPLALLLRLRGTPATLDVEDAPTAARSLREAVARWTYRALAALTRPDKIVASRMLADRLGLARAVPVYGVAEPALPTQRFAKAELLVQFGGSLLAETGLDLFRATVGLIPPGAPIRFVVTGTAPAGALDALPPSVTVAAGLDHAAYRALLDRVDVALSLKLAASEMGQTTFPSKTIEIAAAGILLVTTAVSDVPRLFDDTCAVILREETPRALAAALLAVANDRAAAADRAAAGRARVAERLSPQAVGQALLAATA